MIIISKIEFHFLYFLKKKITKSITNLNIMSIQNKTNVLLIVADDMGYGDFGIFSEGRVKTPHLDRLVSEGICLNQHY